MSTKETKTADRTTYMREYMKKRYHDNKVIGQNESKMGYYVRKGLLSKEDKEKYGVYCAYIIKAKRALDEMKDIDQIKLEEFLFEYLDALNLAEV